MTAAGSAISFRCREAPPRAASAPILHSMAEEPCVLVVEDDAALAAMLADLLGGESYKVAVAVDGQRALHEGLSRHFDVIVRLRLLGMLDTAADLLAILSSSDRAHRWAENGARAGGMTG